MKAYSGIIKLICLIVITPLLIWIFALRDTSHLYRKKCKMQKENQDMFLFTSQNYGQQISESSLQSILSNGKILQIFDDSLSKREIDIINYSPELVASEGEYHLYLGKLILAGRYTELIRMISIMEKAELPTKIISLSFKYERKKRKPSSQIFMTIFLEQIEY